MDMLPETAHEIELDEYLRRKEGDEDEEDR